jgi:hypothetical protein
MKENIIKVNSLHLKDILLEKYKTKISYTPLSSILKSAGIKNPKKYSWPLKIYKTGFDLVFDVY